MKTTFIATNSISAATRLSLMKVQQQIADASKEMNTGRHADVGVSLGYKTGQSISLRQEYTRLNTIVETNSIVATRMDSAQATLQNLVDNAQSFINQLLASRTGETNAASMEADAQSSLDAFVDSMNTAFDGTYLFGGVNSDVPPLAGYFDDPISASRQGVQTAFVGQFGFNQSDPAVSTISATDMQSFLDTAFSDLFADPSWGTDWSAASNQNVRNRISTSQLVQTSVNANDDAFRKLAKAYTMVADLGTQNLDQATYQTVVDQALKDATGAIQQIGELQSQLGVSQAKVSDASERMSIQIDYLTKQVNHLEGVDPNEAATRVSSLLTQMESAYALTGRIMGLSILDYI
jgi:flagellar hook-associated protein 3 FlgL